MNRLPTLKQCLEVCEKNENFKYKKEVIEDYETYIFNYFLASYKDFIEPFPGCEVDAREMRGITFVIDGDGNETCFPFIHKFFNLNENPSTEIERVKSVGIQHIRNKLDGSAISFIRFPNGKIRAKTKFSFESEQAKIAQEIFETNEVYKRVGLLF